MSDIKRPVLRYHGGKWMLAPWIIEFMPVHRVYTEPYGGGWLSAHAEAARADG